MKLQSLARRLVGSGGALGVLVALLGAAPAHAATDNAACSPRATSPIFLAVEDPNLYTLVPGQVLDSFNGGGWTLRGGASLVTTTLADGSTGQVLDLPSGSAAVSPTFCVQADDQTARAMVADISGSDGVTVRATYSGPWLMNWPQTVVTINGTGSEFAASSPFDLLPAARPGEQHVRLTLAAGGTGGEYQVYNLAVDPRMT